ncbi:MAG TPA: CHAT domain-containing tetratricopeptide repeat protein [Thermoanaerobaculia bacterium]|nr:CHAT domain-containing tetratricopeptide repeat protein [Thermoanaerobaculia bacterium]
MTKPACRPASVARMSSNGILAPLVLCLAACTLACGHLPPPRSRPADTLEAPPTPPPLPPAPAAKPAHQRELRLTLPAGTYVRLVIVSTPMDLAVRQAGPDGQQLEEVQLAGGAAEPTHQSWVVNTAGEYRWTVEPRGPQGLAGSAAIALEEQRQAGPCDEARIRAERALIGARWALQQPGDNAVEGARARALVEPALVDVAEVGEQEGALAFQVEMARTARLVGSAEASDLLRQALDLARSLGDRSAEATISEEQAQLLPASKAIEQLKVVLQWRRQLGDEGEEAATLHLIGYYYNDLGDTALALLHFQQALVLQRRNEDVRGEAWTRCEIGFLYGNHGETERALDHLDLAFERGQIAGDPFAQAFALEGSARFEIDLGRLQAAYNDYGRALKLLARFGASPQAAWALDGLGRVLLYLGDLELARQRYGEALKAFEALRIPLGRADALLGIGSTFEEEGQALRALDPYQGALEIIRNNALRQMESLVLYDLGRVHRQLGRRTEAITELREALVREKTDSPARQAQTQVELANVYSETGNLAEAEPAFQHAIRLSNRAPIVEAAAQAGLAHIQRAKGDLTAARASIERALEITEKLRSEVIRPDQRVSFLAGRRRYYEFYVDLLMRLNSLRPGVGHDAEAVAASEQARARGLLDLLAKEQIDVRHGVTPGLKQRESELGERIARLQNRLLASADQAQPDPEIARIEQDLAQAEEEEKDLAAEIWRRQPGYAAVRSPRPLPLHEIQALLDERTALLEYFVGEERSYLFVITDRGLATHQLPARRDLAPLVDRVRSAVNQESRLQAKQFAQDAYALFRVLLQPAGDELRSKPRLMVAPDGMLYSLSFEVLLTAPLEGSGPPGHELPYVIRERSVSYIPSAGVLAQLVTLRRPADELSRSERLFVGFGDPSQEPTPGDRLSSGGAGGCTSGAKYAEKQGDDVRAAIPNRLQPLPAAHSEVCRIAGLFPSERVAVFLGPDATEENVRNNPLIASARNLHFATHGLLDETHPERSGLRLAHADGSPGDGLLQVREVFNLELHADLVVLSACQTGLGKEVSGEGMIGMTRAFLYAGAGSVVVSLWRVDDDSTSDLMVSFYRHLRANADTSEALRSAKLELIDHSRYFHPYFWAPFVLIGRTQ